MVKASGLRLFSGGGGMMVLLLCLFCAGCGVPSADGPADSFRLDFSLPSGSQTRGAIVFLVDGVNGEVFDAMLRGGELPAIKSYFVDRGLYTPRAVCSTPSITLVNLTGIVTGRFAGHHGIIGNNWFDRNQLIWRNYDTIAQKNKLDEDYRVDNIYEQFPESLTISDFYQPHRGSTKFIEDRITGASTFAMGWYELLDRLTLSRFDMIMDFARTYRRFPSVTTVYLLSPDFRAYGCGVSSPEYRQALRHTDRQIGRVLGDLKRAGLLEKVHIALTSDHGMCDVTRHLDLPKFLRQDVGLKVATDHWWENDPFEERLHDYEKFSTVIYGSGDKYMAICLRRAIRREGKVVGYEPWVVRPEFDEFKQYPVTKEGQTQEVNLLRRLTEHEAIDLIICRNGENRIRVLRNGGEVEFTQPPGREGLIAYRRIAGQDPLGLEGKVPAEVLNGKPLTARQWLEVTIDTPYPDLAAQGLAYFRDPKAGDIAMFARDGWDFANQHKAGHGGVDKRDMFTILMLAGPGVPHGQPGPVRTIDLMPTLLQLLNKPIPADLDGKSFLPAGK